MPDSFLHSQRDRRAAGLRLRLAAARLGRVQRRAVDLAAPQAGCKRGNVELRAAHRGGGRGDLVAVAATVRADSRTEGGLPIRGYGVMLLVAVVSAVALAAGGPGGWVSIPELIFSLAFYAIVAGIIGARLFYVIEYWEPQFQRDTPGRRLPPSLNVTQGGLVVYGSLLGAAIAALVVHLRRHGCRSLATPTWSRQV